MNCPYCHNADTKVLDSRPDNEGHAIRRRRECLKCTKRWRTIERVHDEMPMVVKKDGTQQHFERDKLMQSMRTACSKRPVSVQQIDQAVADIEWALVENGKSIVTTIDLGEKVMKALRTLDEIAYVRYASVYRRFKDVAELMHEMQDLMDKAAAEADSASHTDEKMALKRNLPIA